MVQDMVNVKNMVFVKFIPQMILEYANIVVTKEKMDIYQHHYKKEDGGLELIIQQYIICHYIKVIYRLLIVTKHYVIRTYYL